MRCESAHRSVEALAAVYKQLGARTSRVLSHGLADIDLGAGEGGVEDGLRRERREEGAEAGVWV